MYSKIRIKKEKERFIFTRHPWAFRGTIESRDLEKLTNGEPIYLVNSEGRTVATGAYSSESIIAVRIYDFKEITFNLKWWSDRLKNLKEYRELLGYTQNSLTNGFRLVYGESDGIGGLIVDVYKDNFVIQSTTAFIDSQIENIKKALLENFDVNSIYNKSTLDVRRAEGISGSEELLYGNLPHSPTFQENGFEFVADIYEGQKTGYFLDQKDLRQYLINHTELVHKKDVLNLFSYTGATGVYAVKSGATSVHNVDLSERALDMCAVNAELNGISLKSFTTEKSDIFDWLENCNDTFDVIILDPPALIKGNKFKERGEKAYHFLNKHALRVLNPGGILITSSCSHFLAEDEFAAIIRQGANQLGCRIRVLAKIEQSNDHPYSIYFPEGKYLKSLVLQKY